MYKVFVSFFLLLSGWMQAQGIAFRSGTWQEALDEADRQGKLVFVDAYAVWCGPCKRMDENVFTDAKVGAFFNDNFVNVKMDMEKGEGLKLRAKYSVRAYPTLLFVAGDGTLVESVVGYRGPEDLIVAAEAAIKKSIPIEKYESAYLEGNRTPELVYNYVYALNKTGKSSLKVANEYLRTQTDLSTPENLRFILMAAVEADSRIFSLLEQYQNQITALEGTAMFQAKVLEASTNTAKKAITYTQEDLLKTAVEKMKSYYPEKAADFEVSASMGFFLKAKDEKNYLKYCNSYVRDVISDNPLGLIKQARILLDNFPGSRKSMDAAEDIFALAATAAQDSEYYMLYADLLFRHGKAEKAMEALEQAEKIAIEEGEASKNRVESYKKKMGKS
ncbi:MAG: thioredoxin family protein [Saprospiraceae bacterium]|nr:thioredoxin family protein [Saprospiraceae bacterium]